MSQNQANVATIIEFKGQINKYIQNFLIKLQSLHNSYINSVL